MSSPPTAPDVVDRLSERILRIATERGHRVADSRHLLLTLLADPTGRAARFLDHVGCDPASVVVAMDRSLAIEEVTHGEQPKFSRMLLKARKDAQALAERVAAPCGPELMLLGALGDPQVITALGYRPDVEILLARFQGWITPTAPTAPVVAAPPPPPPLPVAAPLVAAPPVAPHIVVTPVMPPPAPVPVAPAAPAAPTVPLTERARDALARARAGAGGTAGLAHLALALTEVETTEASRLLTVTGLDVGRLRTALRRLTAAPAGPFTPGLDAVVAAAHREAHAVDAPAVGPEHLAVGCLREHPSYDELATAVDDHAITSRAMLHDALRGSLRHYLPSGHDAVPGPDPVLFRLHRRLGPDARRGWAWASADARDEGSRSIDAVHLLRGMLEVAGGEVGAVLRDLHVDPRIDVDSLRAAMRARTARGIDRVAVLGVLTLEPETMDALELAVDLAGRVGDRRTDAHHVIPALLGDPRGPARRFVDSLFTITA